MNLNDATNPVAEDTSVQSAEVETNTTETNETDSPEVELDENGEAIAKPEPVVDDTEEIDHDGLKVSVPKALKDSFLRHADYTRKTQELAEQRKSFEASRVTSTTVHNDYVEALANVKHFDAQLARYANFDWTTLESTDPASAQQHFRYFSQLKDARNEAAKAATDKEQSLAMESQRTRATRVQEVQAELTKIMPEWSPGGELDLKLAKFGTANGLSEQDIADATLRNPNFVKLLDLAQFGAETRAKQAAQKRIEAKQAVKPAAEVGNKSPASAKDPERMTTAEWMKYEDERMAKKKGR